jgi:threonine synthase
LYYESTRNRNIKKKFSEVLLTGLAEDGGLYVPKKWVKFSNKDF